MCRILWKPRFSGVNSGVRRTQNWNWKKSCHIWGDAQEEPDNTQEAFVLRVHAAVEPIRSFAANKVEIPLRGRWLSPLSRYLLSSCTSEPRRDEPTSSEAVPQHRRNRRIDEGIRDWDTTEPSTTDVYGSGGLEVCGNWSAPLTPVKKQSKGRNLESTKFSSLTHTHDFRTNSVCTIVSCMRPVVTGSSDTFPDTQPTLIQDNRTSHDCSDTLLPLAPARGPDLSLVWQKANLVAALNVQQVSRCKSLSVWLLHCRSVNLHSSKDLWSQTRPQHKCPALPQQSAESCFKHVNMPTWLATALLVCVYVGAKWF